MTIEDRIAELLASDDQRRDWLKPAVRRFGFLPLYLGWFTALGIRADGSFVRWDHEDDPDVWRDPPVIAPLPEEFLQRLALWQGAKRYPELRALQPARPPHAVTCALCKGEGAGEIHPTFICHCGGCGWMIPDEPHGKSL